MKILHVITSLHTGGAETLVVNLMPRFKALGHEVGVVVFNAELNSYDIPFVSKLKAAINYCRFRFCAMKDPSRPPRGEAVVPRLPWYWNWVMPLGWGMHLIDN